MKVPFPFVLVWLVYVTWCIYLTIMIAKHVNAWPF